MKFIFNVYFPSNKFRFLCFLLNYFQFYLQFSCNFQIAFVQSHRDIVRIYERYVKLENK